MRDSSTCLLGLGVLCGLLLTACSEDAAKGGYLDRCQMTEGCEEGLTCVLGRCTLSCNNITSMGDEKCAAMDAICAGTGCFPPCQGGSACFKGLECYVTSRANTHACQPPADEIVYDIDPASNDFGNATRDAGP